MVRFAARRSRGKKLKSVNTPSTCEHAMNRINVISVGAKGKSPGKEEGYSRKKEACSVRL